eukprot:TRINITY_DN20349_c0_g1_i1.p1 TRINITY_DN20349_c0_g1~~TRINITY_DN20349_c0_g1_i1.p1  ORF type:complete len:353 (-),score=70.75 TRINITY_DN20349_c0_g1_i1:212-1270(-)
MKPNMSRFYGLCVLLVVMMGQLMASDSHPECKVGERKIYGAKLKDYCNDSGKLFSFDKDGVEFGCTAVERSCDSVITTAIQLSTSQIFVFPDRCLPDADFLAVNESPCKLPQCQHTERYTYGMPRAIWCGSEEKRLGRKVFCKAKNEACQQRLGYANRVSDGTPWVFPDTCIPDDFTADPSAKICLVNKCIAADLHVPKGWHVDFYCSGIRDPKMLTQFDGCTSSSTCFKTPVFAQQQPLTQQIFVFPESNCVPKEFTIMKNLTCKDFPQFRPPQPHTGPEPPAHISPPDEALQQPDNTYTEFFVIFVLLVFLGGGFVAYKRYKFGARTGAYSMVPISTQLGDGYDSDRNSA